ncbi:MAG TPA: hypothetical protein PLU37_11790 [Chitinophagaceae bacterium]|nr:hypothetical protein [Chitinophagales bacterium]HPG12206.1 hypothetical protein [Chitinophagaceae bacterium]
MKVVFHAIVFFLLVCVISCNTKDYNRLLRKKHGDYYIEAHYIDEDRIDGLAKYYDEEGQLISEAEYKLGLKYGPACNFYSSGKKRDSMYFVNGLPHGRAFAFDSSGKVLSMLTSYYGVAMGDNIEYNDGSPIKYIFNGFYSNTIMACQYDTIGRCKLNFIDLNPVSNVVYNETDSLLSVKFYLPQPPLMNVSFNIGLLDADDKIDTQTEISVNERIFLDTLLQKPPVDKNYYLSAKLNTIDSSINKLFIYKIEW